MTPILDPYHVPRQPRSHLCGISLFWLLAVCFVLNSRSKTLSLADMCFLAESSTVSGSAPAVEVEEEEEEEAGPASFIKSLIRWLSRSLR